MSDFKVGDKVIIMPNGNKGHIKEINNGYTYPIEVYISSDYEGSYTLDGFRFKNPSLDNQKYYITKDVAASKQTTQPTIETNPYWSIVRANSLFIHISHTDQGNSIIPITSITEIYTDENSVALETKISKYNLGPIPFDEVANLLFAQQQSNSI